MPHCGRSMYERTYQVARRNLRRQNPQVSSQRIARNAQRRDLHVSIRSGLIAWGVRAAKTGPSLVTCYQTVAGILPRWEPKSSSWRSSWSRAYCSWPDFGESDSVTTRQTCLPSLLASSAAARSSSFCSRHSPGDRSPWAGSSTASHNLRRRLASRVLPLTKGLPDRPGKLGVLQTMGSSCRAADRSCGALSHWCGWALAGANGPNSDLGRVNRTSNRTCEGWSPGRAGGGS